MSGRNGSGKPNLGVAGSKDDPIDPLAVDYGSVAAPSERVSRRPPMSELFAQMPARVWLKLWRHKVGDAGWACAMELDHLILASRSRNPVAFYSRRLKKAGLVGSTRTRALRRLEKAGVIKIAPLGKGMSPIVTCLWRPRRD
jgi:hypothetical protein